LYTDETERIDEPWHIQPVETIGVPKDERKEFGSYNQWAKEGKI